MLVPRPDGGWETSMRGVAADGAVERAAACPGGALRRVLGRFLPTGEPGRPRKRPAKLHADKAYDFGAARRALRQRGITPRIGAAGRRVE